MPSRDGVLEYRGKRGVSWRIKYRDAAGRQIMETVGREADGVTRKTAEAELRERLVRVERKGYRRPDRLTFAEYAGTWFAEGERRRGWKRSTIAQYRSTRRRLVDHFGKTPLAAIRPRQVAEYVASMTTTYGAATISRDVSVLHAIFATAKREELVETNPAERAERPKLPRRSWRILEPVEVARVAKAFGDDEQARVVFLTLVLTGLRRSELQALRWRDVDLLDAVLRVRDSKTEDGVRSIALSPRLVEALSGHYARTAYRGDDELVFCHPERGTVYRAETFVEALGKALRAAGITDRLRAFHDLRHTSITNDAAGGSSPIAVMAKAGHANMRTTQTYLHLAGVVFHDEASALERRLLGVENATADATDSAEPSREPVENATPALLSAGLSTEVSTRLSEPQPTSDDLNRVGKPETVG